MSTVGIMSHEAYLASITVHWYEVGLKVSYADRNRSLSDYHLLEKYTEELHEWLTLTCKGNFVIHENGVWFEKAPEAVLFKLSWAGRFK